MVAASFSSLLLPEEERRKSTAYTSVAADLACRGIATTKRSLEYALHNLLIW